MQNKNLVDKWCAFAEMDYLTAVHLSEHMYPKPREIICYHCQQAVEKMLKALLLANGDEILRTHDLALLAENMQNYMEVSERILEICENLTPYGVRFRYPHELYLENHHVEEALADCTEIYEWLKEKIRLMEEENV